jgi:hypothetical protein
MKLPLVEGWTGDIDLTVKQADGTNFPWAGATAVLILKDRDGTVIDTSGDLTTPVDGTARWSPDAADMTVAKQPYSFHLKITKSGKDTFLPQGEPVIVPISAQ